jgi:hypothetical protein
MGTTTPEATLHVSGNAYVSSNLEVGTANLFVDTLNTRVGVGTDTPKESLDVVGNMHLTRVSNVSQIKVDSNVVTEYTGPHDRPLRKYPEVAMTANDNSSTSGYVADQSSTNGFADGLAYRLFDHSTTAYQSGGSQYSGGDSTSSAQTTTSTDGTTHQGVAITLDLATKIRLSYAKITSHTYYGRTPVEGTFLGSNNNSTWDVIGTFSGLSTTAAGQTHTVHIADYATKSAYRYIRLVVTKIHTSAVQNGGSLLEFRELEYYGHEEGSASLDTTLKSVYNVPATTGTQLEVYYDGQDYTGVTSMVNDKAGTATNATISNAGGTITFNDEYKAWTFGGTDPGPGVESTRTDTFIATMPSSFSGNQVHSVSTWFRYEQTFGDDAIFSISPSSGEDTNKSIGVRLNEGQDYEIRYYHWSNDLLVNFPHGHTANTWYHMVVTYTGSITDERRGKSVYINGELCPFVDQTTTGELNLDGGDQLQLARRNDGEKEFFGSIANFRLYSKALNADQVKELYDYQKDYFLGSKSQVTLYKGHLGVGVTEPSGQLELAGDERIQEYPPGPMDDYETLIPGHGVFCASVSSKYTTADTFVAWKAFDKTGGTFWVSDDTDTPETYDQTTGLYTGTRRLSEESVLGEYIILKLPYSINLKSFTIEVRSTELLRGPKSGIVYGRKNNKWEAVHSFSGVTYTSSTRQNIQVTHPNEYYNEFALVTTALAPNGSTYHNINLVELKYFGTPGPTTLDKGSLTLGRSLDVPRVSRYDVDTETPRPEKLVVDFDTTVNSSPTDISGKGNHGTFVNGASYSAPDKAFSFDGTNDHIQVTLNNTAGAWAHSLSVWVKLDDANANGQALMGIGETTARKNSVLYIYAGTSASTKELQYANHNPDSLVIPNGNVNFVVGRWYHIVLTTNADTISSSNQKMYVDGIEQPTAVVGTASNLTLDLDANDNLFIGKQSEPYSGNYFDGQMSNYKIYNTVLEPSEVKKLYNLGRTGRSMVISDTAVGIGKVPEAQLDVRGSMIVRGSLGVSGGGGITHDHDGYRVHAFTTSGVFTALAPLNVDILLVAGGGGGGVDNAGGGGAGGLVFKPNYPISPGTHVVTIGSGGIGTDTDQDTVSTRGGNTSMGTLQALGGGIGLNGDPTPGTTNQSGGSAGGAEGEGYNSSSLGTATQLTLAFDGSDAPYGFGNVGGAGGGGAGGGGGGAGEAGYNGWTGGGGKGGDGKYEVTYGETTYNFADMFGTSHGDIISGEAWFAGGGAGGNNNGDDFTVNGGKGGGASNISGTVRDGQANTGGGGSGQTWVGTGVPTMSSRGGHGGTGIILLRYKI